MASPIVETLDNGLQVIVKENRTAPVADIRIYVKTGSMYEQEYLGTGISHVFEHLINGGSTATQTEEQISERINGLGGANNAYTTKDHTCYYIKTSADRTTDAIDLMADWMMNSLFPEAEFRREIRVVLEELRKGQDEPQRQLYELLDDTLFRHHPTKFPVIGYENLITTITRDDIVTYYRRMYVPNNMVLVAVGDFEARRIVDHVRAVFQNFERRPIPLIALPAEPRQLGKRLRTKKIPGLGETYFTVAFRTVGIDHPDLFPLDILSHILSNGRSSRLVASIQENQRLVSSIYSYSHTPACDAGVFAIGGTCGDENVDTALAAIQAELAKVQSEAVTAEELRKAVKQMTAENILGNQTASDEAAELGVNMITTANPDFNQFYLERIRQVSPADIQRVATDYFVTDNTTVVLLRPDSLETVTAESQPAARNHEIQKIELANGMRLLAKQNPAVPLMNIQLLFLGGVLYEPENQAGISNIAAEMLTRGTTTRTRDEIALVFDRIGGQFTSSSGNNTFGLTAEVLKEDFDTALELVADVIQHPVFPESEWITVQKNVLSAIARRNDNWESELATHFRHHYFGRHPYSRDSLGDASAVESMTVADIERFYRRHADPRRCVIAVFGDIDTAAVSDRVTAAFRDFTPTSDALPDISPPEPPRENRQIVEPVRKNVASVFIGYPGIAVTNTDDRYPLIVLDAILSGYGYPGGWLQRELRGGDRDLVYVVHAFNFSGLHPGYFGIIAASSPEKMDRVTATIFSVMDQIRGGPVNAEELAKAKGICKVMEQLSRQTNGAMGLQAAVEELYGLGYDHSETYTSRIDGVTAEAVLAVAQKYLTNYVMVRTEPAPAQP